MWTSTKRLHGECVRTKYHVKLASTFVHEEGATFIEDSMHSHRCFTVIGEAAGWLEWQMEPNGVDLGFDWFADAFADFDLLRDQIE